ncbi:TPA: hypothetical protein UMV35_004029 [Stenotrophomonas maltophilia]|nr:hypothetical protein [Stenotrophomonas maltophilia]HEL3751688.1 hypothetical protein [Stenotrophomonas maltophilia]HEL7731336.1 hypothetical protein [Stenotrophomonas maltophilia]
MGKSASHTEPRRWAKVLIVDGVMALVRHGSTDDDGYEIRCSIQCEGAESSVALLGNHPFPQEAFDAAGVELVREVIRSARHFGLRPLLATDGSTFTSLKDGFWTDASQIDHQVAELDLALNGVSTPGVTLGMLLHQARGVRAAQGHPAFQAALHTTREMGMSTCTCREGVA